MSDESVMKKALEDSNNKYAPDPIEGRGSGNPAADGPNLRFQPAPHMRGYAPPDSSPEVRRRNAEQDKNLHGEPPKPRKP